MVDATTQAALEAEILYWRALIYADFVGDTLRATNATIDKVVSGSSDTELNGTYESFSHNVISVGAVTHNETGSDTLAVSMSGLVVNNNAFLNMIGNKSNWQGRIARLWFYCTDSSENQIGSIIPYYTGYMNDISINGNPESQTVTLTIENYIASLTNAQNKNYLSQKLFDDGDLSAEAAIASANGTKGAGLSDVSGVMDTTLFMERFKFGGWPG